MGKARRSAPELINYWTQRVKDLLQMRNNLDEDDLAYVVTKIETLKDERLKQCITSLIGWGDEERADLETFCALGLELMKDARPSAIRAATDRIELRFLARQLVESKVSDK